MAEAKRDSNHVPTLIGVSSVDGTTPTLAAVNPVNGRLLVDTSGGSGTVTSVSVTSANGFAGNVATPTTTPAITLSTTVTGVLKGNGTAISAATNADLPAMSSTVGGAVPTPPNNTTTFLRGDGTFATPAGGGTVTSVASADGSVTVTSPTSTVDLAVVKAPKWSTARNLAGNSVDGSANVAFANNFVVQGTADAGLSGAQFLGALGTGIVKNTTTTGVLSIAVAGDFPTLNQNTSGSAASFTGSLVGDVTGTQGATVVGKINGVSLGGLATGILKNTTTTGVPSIAVAGDFPTLNQNTTGSAATLTTARTIGTLTGDVTTAGSTFNGSANNTNATVLATVNSNVGSFGSATQVGTFTVNGKGLTTAAANVTITPAVGSITGLGTGVGTALTVNLGSAGALASLSTAQTFTATQTTSLINTTPQALSVTTNAATADISHGIQNFTNSSAATMTITLTTTSAVDGQMKIVRIYDASAVAQTISWVGTENSGVSAPTTSNGSATLPLSVCFQFNGSTSKWRCLASS